MLEIQQEFLRTSISSLGGFGFAKSPAEQWSQKKSVKPVVQDKWVLTRGTFICHTVVSLGHDG